MQTFFKLKGYLHFILLNILCCNLLKGQDALYLSPGAKMAIDTATIFTSIGNITLNQGAEFVHNGVLYVKNVSNGSTWSDRSNFSGMGLVVFQGNKEITYSGFTSFHDLHVNGAQVNLSNSSIITVSNQLLLQLGVINAGTGSMLYVANPSVDAILPHASNKTFSKSYINGSLKRNIAVNKLTYDFPVGTAGGVHLLSFINNLLTGANNLTASYGAKQGTDNGIKPTNVSSYTSVNANGVWYLKPETIPTGGSYGLRLSLEGFTGLIDNGFSILGRPFNSSKGEDWKIPSGSVLPQDGTAGRTVVSGFTQRENITDFELSQFGIGMSTIAPGAPDIRLFPNPTNGILNINLPNAQEYTLIVSNAQGKRILQQKMIQSSQIQLYRFHPGTYTVSIYSDANTLVVTRKIILIK